MSTAFDIIAEDFSRELTTIRELVRNAYGEDDAEGKPPASQGVRAAASNASMLLLAASFEEFVREIIRATATTVLSGENIEGLPRQLSLAVWERVIFLLKGQKFGKSTFDTASANSQISVLKNFCLDRTFDPAVPDIIAYNQNNMTVSEFNILFKRVGISDYAKDISRTTDFQDFFGAIDFDQAHGELVAYWEDFYRTRNEIAHSIGALRTTGSNKIMQFIEFFDIVRRNINRDLNGRLAQDSA